MDRARAESVEVGNLVVRIIADAKQLETSLAKASGDFKKFGNDADKAGKSVQASGAAMGRSIGTVVAGLGGMFTAFLSVNAVIQAFNKAVADITALDNLSQATGVGVPSR